MSGVKCSSHTPTPRAYARAREAIVQDYERRRAQQVATLTAERDIARVNASDKVVAEAGRSALSVQSAEEQRTAATARVETEQARAMNASGTRLIADQATSGQGPESLQQPVEGMQHAIATARLVAPILVDIAPAARASLVTVAEMLDDLPASSPNSHSLREEFAVLVNTAGSDSPATREVTEESARDLATRIGMSADAAKRQARAIDSLGSFFASRGYQVHQLDSEPAPALLVERNGYGLEWGVTLRPDGSWSVSSDAVAVSIGDAPSAKRTAAPDASTREELARHAMAARQVLDDSSVGESAGLTQHLPFADTLPVIRLGKTAHADEPIQRTEAASNGAS